jgi:Ca2+-binding EF-hand superfamily protein
MNSIDTRPGLGTDTANLPTTDRWMTVDEAAAQFFAWFDRNDDGTITVSEIVDAVDPSGGHAAQLHGVVRALVDLMDPDDDGDLVAADVAAALETLDTNDDGSLTPADLGSELAQQGLAPVLGVMLQGGPVPGPPQREQGVAIDAVVDSLTQRFDADDDGSLTLAELLAELDPRGHRQKLDDALTALVDAVDTDDDGTMSGAELTAAVASLDGNGNGRLDRGDHVPGPQSPDDIDLVGVLLPKFRHFDAGEADAVA